MYNIGCELQSGGGGGVFMKILTAIASDVCDQGKYNIDYY